MLHGRDAAPPSELKRLVRATGFVLSFAAAVAFLVGLVDVRLKTTTGTSGFERAYHATARVKLAEVGGGRDRALAWTYAPMLQEAPRLRGSGFNLAARIRKSPASARGFSEWRASRFQESRRRSFRWSGNARA
jgi:hypothetical protein